MKKIYIAHSRDFDYLNELYAPLKQADFLSNYELIFPHEQKQENHNLRDFYRTIDLVIAEVSMPSTGLGIELGWASDDNKKVCCIYKSGTQPSSSLNAITDQFYEYHNTDELLNIVRQIVEHDDRQ